MSTIERLAENAKAYADESGDDEFTVFIKLLLDAAAEHAVLREALAGMIEMAEFWINREDIRGATEDRYNLWLALGHRSDAMVKAKAALSQGEAGNG
jgi:hypothetical protein